MPKSDHHDDDSTIHVDDDGFVEGISEAKQKYGRFNLAIIGNTGVGKSSLVNAVFGSQRADVGLGLPVTRGVRYYADDSFGMWDFEGFEIGSEKSPAETLHSHLQTIAQCPADQQISVVWYCVLHNSDRLTPPDIEMIRELDRAGLPVVLVLTKVEWTKHPISGKYRAPEGTERFREWLENPYSGAESIDLPVRHVALTSAVSRDGKGTGHGLGDLVAKTLELVPADTQDSFRIAQRLNLPWKRELSRKVMLASSTAAGAAAATPIPAADAATLAPIQMTMMGRIAFIYDLELKTMASPSVLGQLASQLSGQALARSFIKIIPVAGIVLNASVASAITAAAGEGWMRLCEKVHTGEIDLSQVEEVISEFAPTVRSLLKNMMSQKAGSAQNAEPSPE